jgi:hypothetical protein
MWNQAAKFRGPAWSRMMAEVGRGSPAVREDDGRDGRDGREGYVRMVREAAGALFTTAADVLEGFSPNTVANIVLLLTGIKCNKECDWTATAVDETCLAFPGEGGGSAGGSGGAGAGRCRCGSARGWRGGRARTGSGSGACCSSGTAR